MENNSTDDHTYRLGKNLPTYDGKSVTILDIPCIRETVEDDDDDVTFSSAVGSRIDAIIKMAIARTKLTVKMHMLVGYTDKGDPIWYT